MFIINQSGFDVDYHITENANSNPIANGPLYDQDKATVPITSGDYFTLSVDYPSSEQTAPIVESAMSANDGLIINQNAGSVETSDPGTPPNCCSWVRRDGAWTHTAASCESGYKCRDDIEERYTTGIEGQTIDVRCMVDQ